MTRTDDIRDEILFVGGLDSDTDPHFLTKGDWLEATNVIKSEDGKNGVLSKIKGNEEVLDFANYVNLVGWCKYHRNGSYILFIKGDPSMIGNPDKIVEYNPNTDEETTVIASDLLNFNTAYYVKADMIDDWLSWADGYNAPRMINVADTKSYTGTITESYLDSCRRPALYVPEVLLAYDSVVAYSNLDGGYQFKYRYVYDDYRYSVYSKASDMVIPLSTTRNSEGFNSYGTENVIYIKFDSGNDTVGWVDVIVKEGNEGQWGRFIKIDKAHPENVYTVAATPVLMTSALSDNTEYYVRFYNNESRTIVADGTKQYDTIPDIAETVSAIGENRFVWGGLTDGKELVPLTVTLTAKKNSPVLWENFPISSTEISSVDPSIMYVYFDLDNLRGAGGRAIWNVGDYVHFDYKFTVTLNGSPVVLTHDEYVFVTERQTTIDGLGQHIASRTAGATGALGSIARYNIATNTIGMTIVFFSGTISAITTPYTIDASIIKNTGYDYTSLYGYTNDQEFKNNKTHKLGIVYSDKYGKKWPVISSSGSSLSFTAVGDGFNNIEYTITSTPPTDAVAYRWVYAYKPTTFVQTTVTDVSYIANEDQSSGILLNKIALDVSAAGKMTFPHYEFAAGDYIRIIREGGVYSTYGDYVTGMQLFRVEEVLDTLDDGTETFAGKWLVITPSSKSGWNYDSAATITNSKFLNAVIEVFKQNTTTEEDLYYEIGGGGICEDGVHKDWFTGTNIGRLNQGDAWFRPVLRYLRSGAVRTLIADSLIQLEDPYPFDAANSRYLSIGDPNIEYAESIVKYENLLRWTNKYFFDTKVNGLSTFDFDDKKEVSDSYGNIIGIEEQGNSLTVICEKKVLSTYVGATEYQDAQGNPQVITSDRVLGYLRPLLGDYGTFLKESILNNGDYIYFLDARNGVFVRKTVNGIFPISGKIQTGGYEYDYKMHAYFKNKCKALMASYYDQGSGSVSIDDYSIREYVKVFTGYDNEYKNVYVTFWDTIDNTNNETIIFHEPSNRWVSNISAEYGSDSFNSESAVIDSISSIDTESIDITNMETTYVETGDVGSVLVIQNEAIQTMYIVGITADYAGYTTGSLGIAIHFINNYYDESFLPLNDILMTIAGTTNYNGTYEGKYVLRSGHIWYYDIPYIANESFSEGSYATVNYSELLRLIVNDYIVGASDAYLYLLNTSIDGIHEIIDYSSLYNYFNIRGTIATTEHSGNFIVEPPFILDIDYEDETTAKVTILNDITVYAGNYIKIEYSDWMDGEYEVLQDCIDNNIIYISAEYSSSSVSSSASDPTDASGLVSVRRTQMDIDGMIPHLDDGDTITVYGTVANDGDYTVVGNYTDTSTLYFEEIVTGTETIGYIILTSSGNAIITTSEDVTVYDGEYVYIEGTDSYTVSGNNDGYYEVVNNVINNNVIEINASFGSPSSQGILTIGLKKITSIVGNKITLNIPITVTKGDSVTIEDTYLNDGSYVISESTVDSYVVYVEDNLQTESNVGYLSVTTFNLTNAFQGYLGIDSFFHSFLNGKLWKHNSSTAARCNFYGIQQNSTVTFVAKEPPLENKIFNSIEIHSNKKWEVTEITSPANETYVWGMYSRIKKGLFKIIDGVYKSNFLRNMKTTSSTATQSELYSGDELQGRYLQIKLTNDDTTAVDLLKVHVNSEPTK